MYRSGKMSLITSGKEAKETGKGLKKLYFEGRQKEEMREERKLCHLHLQCFETSFFGHWYIQQCH